MLVVVSCSLHERHISFDLICRMILPRFCSEEFFTYSCWSFFRTTHYTHCRMARHDKNYNTTYQVHMKPYGTLYTRYVYLILLLLLIGTFPSTSGTVTVCASSDSGGVLGVSYSIGLIQNNDDDNNNK